MTANIRFCHSNIINCYAFKHEGVKCPEYGEKLNLPGLRGFNAGADMDGFYQVNITIIFEPVLATNPGCAGLF